MDTKWAIDNDALWARCGGIGRPRSRSGLLGPEAAYAHFNCKITAFDKSLILVAHTVLVGKNRWTVKMTGMKVVYR